MSGFVNLGAGDDVRTLDAGLVEAPEETASIGDLVFNDTNGNGIQDPDEPGVAGVSVTVEDRNGVTVNTTD